MVEAWGVWVACELPGVATYSLEYAAEVHQRPASQMHRGLSEFEGCPLVKMKEESEVTVHNRYLRNRLIRTRKERAAGVRIKNNFLSYRNPDEQTERALCLTYMTSKTKGKNRNFGCN